MYITLNRDENNWTMTWLNSFSQYMLLIMSTIKWDIQVQFFIYLSCQQFLLIDAFKEKVNNLRVILFTIFSCLYSVKINSSKYITQSVYHIILTCLLSSEKKVALTRKLKSKRKLGIFITQNKPGFFLSFPRVVYW